MNSNIMEAHPATLWQHTEHILGSQELSAQHCTAERASTPPPQQLHERPAAARPADLSINLLHPVKPQHLLDLESAAAPAPTAATGSGRWRSTPRNAERGRRRERRRLTSEKAAEDKLSVPVRRRP